MIGSLDLCLLPQRNPYSGPPVADETPHASGASMGAGTCADASIQRSSEYHQVGSSSSRTGLQEIGWGGPRGPIPHDGLTELRVCCVGSAVLGLVSESNSLRMGEVGLGFVHIFVEVFRVLNVMQHVWDNLQVTEQVWDGMAGLASFVS